MGSYINLMGREKSFSKLKRKIGINLVLWEIKINLVLAPAAPRIAPLAPRIAPLAPRNAPVAPLKTPTDPDVTIWPRRWLR